MDRYAVNAVLVDALRRGQYADCDAEKRSTYVWWAENGTVPVGHQQVVAIVKTV